MKPIHDVQNIPPEAIELFEAAGYIDADTIFDHKISVITSELVKANKVLEIIGVEPTREMVTKWLQPLEVLYGITLEEDNLKVDPMMLIDTEDIIDRQFSLPISEQYLKNNNIDISELPAGNPRFIEKEQAQEFLSNTKSETLSYDVLSDQTSEVPIDPIEDEVTLLFDKPSAKKSGSQVLDMNRVLKMETFQKEGSHVSPIARSEDVNHIRTVSKDTNKGVNPNSKFYVKGVFHKDSSRFKYGCRWFIFINLLILLSFAITSLVLVDKDKYNWVIWAPLLAVLGIILYFTLAQSSKCPVCNQKQFAPKICRKHRDAHHWPVLGYMLPTALHALIFKWFRCIYCGTSIRLKK